MILAAIGPAVFNIVTNLQQIDKSGKAVIAEHEVIGASVFEVMGTSGTRFKISGVVHPEVTGVNGAVTVLEGLKDTGVPMPFMRGDFTPLGWVIVEEIQRGDANLNAYGLGRDISFSATLIAVGQPTAASLATQVVRILS